MLYIIKNHICSKWKGYLLGVVLLIPIILYSMNFWKNGISKDPEQWAQFGDYIGGVYSVITAFVVIYISENLRFNRERKQKKKKIAEEIFNQISTVKRGYNLNSINKLIRLANQSKLHFSTFESDMVEGLANHFLCVSNNEIDLDDDLVTRVERRMKSIYE